MLSFQFTAIDDPTKRTFVVLFIGDEQHMGAMRVFLAYSTAAALEVWERFSDNMGSEALELRNMLTTITISNSEGGRPTVEIQGNVAVLLLVSVMRNQNTGTQFAIGDHTYFLGVFPKLFVEPGVPNNGVYVVRTGEEHRAITVFSQRQACDVVARYSQFDISGDGVNHATMIAESGLPEESDSAPIEVTGNAAFWIAVCLTALTGNTAGS